MILFFTPAMYFTSVIAALVIGYILGRKGRK